MSNNYALLIFIMISTLLSVNFVTAESPFSDRIYTAIENCTGCSYDAECVPLGTLINPNHYCSEGGVWKSKSFFNLSNGRNVEIKVMPETASAKAIERLGELKFNITLKQAGKGEFFSYVVYHLTAEKEAKLFGLIKKKAKIEVDVDAENDGKIISIKRPWWSFIASGV